MTRQVGGGLHVRYEKAGLIFDALPIPHNADAVIVEALVRLPSKAPCEKTDFTLQWNTSGPRMPAELVFAPKRQKNLHVLFRLSVPDTTSRAVVRWREHELGGVEVPLINQIAILDGVSLELPTFHVNLLGQNVACQALVSGQSKSVFASAILRSNGILAPVIDWPYLVMVHNDLEREVGAVRIPITSEEMRQRQILSTALLPRLPNQGGYIVSWNLGARRLGTRRLRVITKKTFAKSLRVSATRFLLETDDHTEVLVRGLPQHQGKVHFDGVRRVMPIFYVSSNEAGVAGLAPFILRALVGDTVTTLAIERDRLVTDGLREVKFDFLSLKDLRDVKHFSLASGDRVLGNLAMDAAPSAAFTAEGGFAPLDNFLWSPVAEEQLTDRLGKLLDGE